MRLDAGAMCLLIYGDVAGRDTTRRILDEECVAFKCEALPQMWHKQRPCLFYSDDITRQFNELENCGGRRFKALIVQELLHLKALIHKVNKMFWVAKNNFIAYNRDEYYFKLYYPICIEHIK